MKPAFFIYMQNDRKLESLEALLRPVVEDLGFEFVDLELRSELGRLSLCLLVDRPGGITIGECASLSREIGPHLEVADPFAGRYSLEVSSPGINRPLRTEEHFERFSGEKVLVKTRETIEGRKVFRGLNRGLDDFGNILIEDEGAGCTYKVPFNVVRTARLDPEIKIGSAKKQHSGKRKKNA